MHSFRRFFGDFAHYGLYLYSQVYMYKNLTYLIWIQLICSIKDSKLTEMVTPDCSSSPRTQDHLLGSTSKQIYIDRLQLLLLYSDGCCIYWNKQINNKIKKITGLSVGGISFILFKTKKKEDLRFF